MRNPLKALTAGFILSLSLALCAEESSPAPKLDAPSVTEVLSIPKPDRNKSSATDVHESETMVARVMRLAPGASIKEHFHPYFDETFFVHSGALNVMLDDKEYPVKAGDLVFMPAGTIISGTNAGDDEAIVVITWANIGKKGPLFVYGRPGKEEPSGSH